MISTVSVCLTLFYRIGTGEEDHGVEGCSTTYLSRCPRGLHKYIECRRRRLCRLRELAFRCALSCRCHGVTTLRSGLTKLPILWTCRISLGQGTMTTATGWHSGISDIKRPALMATALAPVDSIVECGSAGSTPDSTG